MSLARVKKTGGADGDRTAEMTMPAPSDAEGLGIAALKRPIRRVVTAQINGSLARLGSSGVGSSSGAAVWTIDPAAVESVFAPTSGEASFGGVGQADSDIKNVVLHGVQLLAVQSSFPVTLGINISGVEGKHYTKDGSGFARVVMAGEKWSGAEYLTKPDEALINSDYLQKYPGMTVDNLRHKNIVRVPDEQFVFVGFDHPVVEMLEANSEVLQINIRDAELIDNRWYKVNSGVFEDCARLLDSELLQNLPIMDLSNFQLDVCRVGSVAWDSPAEACANTGRSQQASEMVLTRDNTISVQLAIEYGFM